MVTIVGPTLPAPYYDRVESIWAELIEEFGIDRPVNPYPHFTLYGLGDGADTDEVVAAVEDAAADHGPAATHTAGLGVFSGHHVWIPVARTDPVADLHRDVVEALTDVGTAPTPYYDSHRWFPHVGLALNVDATVAGEVVTHLIDRELEWEFTVDSIAITRPESEGGQHELVASVDL